jgi:hypothetical protein
MLRQVIGAYVIAQTKSVRISFLLLILIVLLIPIHPRDHDQD